MPVQVTRTVDVPRPYPVPVPVNHVKHVHLTQPQPAILNQGWAGRSIGVQGGWQPQPQGWGPAPAAW